jgi:transposase InsO family protein
MFLEEEIKALRGRDQRDYEVVLMSDLGEAHSKKIISACKKYGVTKTSTAGYTPQHNAFVERWFRTNSEMSRCQILKGILGIVAKTCDVYIQQDTIHVWEYGGVNKNSVSTPVP